MSLDGASCDRGGALLCFGIDREGAVVPEPIDGRLAFLSTSGFSPGEGVEAADALCAAEAAEEGLTGSFKALLATEEASAISRFDLGDAPLLRLDGAVIVERAEELAQKIWNTPISQTAGGAYVANAPVWTGAEEFYGEPGSAESTCESWSQSSDAQTGHATIASIIYSPTTGRAFFEWACDRAEPVFCIEE